METLFKGLIDKLAWHKAVSRIPVVTWYMSGGSYRTKAVFYISLHHAV